MKHFIVRLLLVCVISIVLSGTVSAVSITNGDFAAGFDGWMTLTDGESGGNDFSIIDGAARMEIDYFETTGDIFGSPISEAFWENALQTDLDLSIQLDHHIELSFDWYFDGDDGDPLSGDYFSVGLNDRNGRSHKANGDYGFLIDPISEYGSGSASYILDFSTFANSDEWSLDFMLGVGDDFNGLGSFLEIDNVQLKATANRATPPVAAPAAVPEPSTFAFVFIGILGLFVFAKFGRKQE